jgi:hypothetical protein
MIQVPDDRDDLPPDMAGITIRYAETDSLVVDVSADPGLEMIISPVFNAIIRGCLDGRKPVAVITEHLDRVRKAFSRVASEMSETKQIGLAGELLVLRHVMIPSLGPRATSLWSGPLFERHDFVGDVAHVEVKCTTRSMDQHRISRLDQLRVEEGKRLLLASVQLERSIAGSQTVATIRDEVIATLQDDGPSLGEFDRKLAALGWNEQLVQSGALLRFNVRSLLFFAVQGTFPRLPDDYVPPRGVVGIEYDINISACPTMSPLEVRQLVAMM